MVEYPQKTIKRIQELLKSEALFISATPCMGDKKMMNGLFTLLSKLGITPEIKSIKIPYLESIIENGGLHIKENESIAQTANQYFVVAQ